MESMQDKFMTTVRIGPKGQIVIPKEVRAMFGLEPGDSLILLADRERGIALQSSRYYDSFVRAVFDNGAKAAAARRAGGGDAGVCLCAGAGAERGGRRVNILEVEGLCKTYPAFELRDVSFAVAPGTIMGFIGRNGAGKSTTIKSILNLVHPDSGRVTMFGQDFLRQ